MKQKNKNMSDVRAFAFVNDGRGLKVG